MKLAAWAKLTTSLRIVGVRKDGYHLIEAEMVSVSLADTVEIGASDETRVTYVDETGQQLRWTEGSDLVADALRLVGRTAEVQVRKRIPPGAGLGGGSADAAAVLWAFGWDDIAQASEIGADVSFCVLGGRAKVTGIGEHLVPLVHEDRTFTLLTPDLHCSTPRVYAAWDALTPSQQVGVQGNDLEMAAVSAYPALAHARDELGEITGMTPRLAGSGSTWFVEGAFGHPRTRVVRSVASRPPNPPRQRR